MAQRRQPKGNGNGGQFAPSTTGKKPPTASQIPVKKTSAEEYEEATTTETRYQILRRGVVKQLGIDYNVPPEQIPDHLEYGELLAIYDHLEDARHDARYSDNFSVTQPREVMEDNYRTLGYEQSEAALKADYVLGDIEWEGPQYDPRHRGDDWY